MEFPVEIPNSKIFDGLEILLRSGGEDSYEDCNCRSVKKNLMIELDSGLEMVFWDCPRNLAIRIERSETAPIGIKVVKTKAVSFNFVLESDSDLYKNSEAVGVGVEQ
ncbi:hypothetical protein SDJN03_26620, partial [Cucurbita argyrosperma subsp. sororia]